MSVIESMRILKGLETSKEFWFVIFILFLFFILRLPSLFEPLWYGDEGIYQVIGTSLNNGKLLYAEIFDNKPPLLYWLYAILNSDQFTIRLASLIFGVLSIVIFFLLSKKLFGNTKNKIHFVTTFVFAVLFGLPTFEGNIANAENFMLLPIIISAFFILNVKKQAPNRPLINHSSLILNPYFFSGLLLGIAFLFKIVAIFDFAAFFIFYFIINFDSLKKIIRPPAIIIGFSLPILAVSLFFILNNTFIDFMNAAFFTNISYVSYGNKIGGTPLLLFVKLILLVGFTLYIFAKRKKFDTTILFISIWFAFSLFNALFSQRPYTHYLLVLIPSFSLMIGLILLDKKHQKIIAIIFIIVLLTITKVFGISNFNKSINYYQNFISYIKSEKTMTSYQAFFDKNTPFDYEIARFIKPKIEKHDTIFVWGNNAQLYQLIGVVAPAKYVVAYHMTSYKDGVESTKTAIEKTKPKFIIVMSNRKTIPFPLIGYSKKININKATIYERIF